MGIDFGFSAGNTSTGTNNSGTKTTQKVLTQGGIDKIIYDIMASDQGLAALASGENLSGGSKSSTKTLLAQDLIAKIAGEIANVTAATTETANSSSSSSTNEKKGGAKTVICTELRRQEKIPADIYQLAQNHSDEINPLVYRGYIQWAPKVVQKMQQSERLSAFLAPIVLSRYKMIVTGKFHFLGALTIYVGHPVCWLIGAFVSRGEKHARAIS